MFLNAVTPAAITRARVEISLGATVTQWDRVRSTTDPAASTTYYRIPSRTQGATHEVAVTATRDGISLQCSCPAGVNGRPCWHAGAVVLAMSGECEVRVPHRHPAVRPSVGTLAGQSDAT